MTVVKFIFIFFCLSTGLTIANAQVRATATSPNGKLTIELLSSEGRLQYQIKYLNHDIIRPSTLGFRFKNQRPLLDNLVLVGIERAVINEPWNKIWGQSKFVENHFNQLSATYREQDGLYREFTVTFRVYDDGVGFRYELPKQEHLNNFSITSEETEFALAGDYDAWWTPADFDSYEALYRKTKSADIEAVNTPITLRTDNNIYLSIHEAALTNYSGMTLKKNRRDSLTLYADLVPWPDGTKVKGKTPFITPWRTIQVGGSAGDLIESDLIVNLNEPNVLSDTSWIKPMKYIGIWWAMHMRKYTWEAGPRHGATTENTMDYIDFAKDHGIGGVLVEGWNKGWETWHTGENIQSFTQAYEDFDLRKVSKYGQDNDVYLIGHHETGGNIPIYEAQMEEAFKLYHDVGVRVLKTGYAGKMYPEGVYHHGQQMVNHYRDVLKLAAKYKIMLNAHEPIKPTGIRRTYPNMMTREGGRGMEWNGWSEGNAPEHTVTLPFTRLLAGPMDYTPGIFNIKFDPQGQYRVHTTLAKQLAMFVALFSPLQMAADMIENYEEQPAFDFISNVPTTWDTTKVISGEIGDFISIARRSGTDWYVGNMTDEVPRRLSIALDFLEDNTAYMVYAYSDDMATDFKDNPTAIAIDKFQVVSTDIIEVSMASGGGQALFITPINDSSVKQSTTLAKFNSKSKQSFEKFKRGPRYGEIESIKHKALNKSVKNHSVYDKSYSGGGKNALVDGIVGGPDYKELWQGYRQKDIDVVIDLEKATMISSIQIGFLQSILHSILLPTQVTFSISYDGIEYKNVGKAKYHTVEDGPDYQRKTFKATFPESSVRFIRIKAKNIENLPDWHVRPGQEAFIFSDEIIVH
jgi:alpha-glucosidase